MNVKHYLKMTATRGPRPMGRPHFMWMDPAVLSAKAYFLREGNSLRRIMGLGSRV